MYYWSKLQIRSFNDYLSLVLNPFNKGKGLWKFNNSLLYEKDYSKNGRGNIIDLKKQYAALIYNRNKIQEIDHNELQLTINVQLFLEMLLLEIRGKTISFASYSARNKRSPCRHRRPFVDLDHQIWGKLKFYWCKYFNVGRLSISAKISWTVSVSLPPINSINQ